MKEMEKESHTNPGNWSINEFSHCSCTFNLEDNIIFAILNKVDALKVCILQNPEHFVYNSSRLVLIPFLISAHFILILKLPVKQYENVALLFYYVFASIYIQ